MKIRVKLYALLGEYLPAHAKKNEADVDIPENAGVTEILTSIGVPLDKCHLVLVNGNFIAPSERDTRTLNEGDALAVWPPVAGG